MAILAMKTAEKNHGLEAHATFDEAHALTDP